MDLTHPCALAFWKGGLVIGSLMVLLIFVVFGAAVVWVKDKGVRHG